MRKYGSLCLVGISGRGLRAWGLLMFFLLKKNDLDFKKVNILPHKYTCNGGEG